MSRFIRPLLFLLVALCSNAWADSYYQIDLLVFQQPLSTPEHKTVAPSIADINARLFTNDQLLSPDFWQLSSEQNKLMSNPDFQPIAHLSWRQSFSENTPSLPWSIDTSQLSPENFQLINTAQITGTIAVTKNRYVELGLDLDVQGASQVFNVNAKRRLKDKETYYIDRPGVGLLVKVTPIKTTG